MTIRASGRRCRDRSDAGESLVELLVSVMIMGIAVTAILGALGMSATSSSLHRDQGKAQNLLHNWSEKVSASAYTPCATAADVVAPDPLPTGFTSSVAWVHWWGGSTFNAPSCTSASDTGLQLIRLAISGSAGGGMAGSASADIVVRKPCESSC